MTSELRVASELWTLLESSLLAQAKLLVRDLAKEANADPRQLWEKVKADLVLQAVELPEYPEPTFCSYQLRDGPIAQKCLKPVLLGHTLCPAHCGRLSPAVPLSQFLPKVIRYQNESDPGDIYFQRVGGSNVVYTSDLKSAGILHDSKLIRFDIQEGSPPSDLYR